VDSLLSGSTGRSALAWRLFLETGMRKGEVLALSFSDIDWGDGTVRIGATLTAEGGGWRVVERVKSGTAHIMPLSDRLTALLRAELNDDGISPRTYVFQGAHGRPVTPSSLERWWARDCKAAGLSGRVIHELRHTWATRALEAGVQPSVVAKIMGHANVATTLRHYRHVSMDEMRLAVNLVSSKLPQGPVVVTANVTAGESQAPESRG
jgi:integrase